LNWIVSFFADNKVVIAIANFGGALAILYLVARWVIRTSRFAIEARNKSVRVARRSRRFRTAMLGYRCADNPSTFIAVILRSLLIYILFMFLTLSFVAGGFDPITGNYGDGINGVLTLRGKLEIVGASIATAYLTFHFFASIAGLSSTVINANERKRLAKLGVPASRRRIRYASIF